VKKPVRLIVIGGSAGSLQVVLKILGYLKSSYSIPILLVLHRNVQYDSSLQELLVLKTTLNAKEVEEKDAIKPGYVYFCPADYHVLVEKDFSFSLDDSEKVNFSRPSIDVVFRSAADILGDQLLCVLLSGANSDGAEGLKQVKEKGGITVIQDPEEAQVPFMPQQALRIMQSDYVLDSNQIAGLLNSLVL
jgi:two-component system chemotaxis response regulator CheB